MKLYLYLLISVLFISGCYTMINHPEVEVYYEREDGEEYLAEDYDVFVDEDCTTCHETLIPQEHFSPLIPAHELGSNWNVLPWWLDTKYLMFFSDSNDSSSGVSGYQHANSQKRNDLPPPQQSGYVPISRGGSAASANTQSAAKATQVNEGSNATSKTRSAVGSQNSGSSSRSSSSSSSNRKFRKRK